MVSIVVALVVMCSWLLPEGSFDAGPYELRSKTESIEECQAKKWDGEICVYTKDNGAMLYTKRHGGTVRAESVGTEQ